ncbi:UPF0306 protein [Bacteroidia bacterium]|nr:UPF0306 protein [Bacteroidia bacterium]
MEAKIIQFIEQHHVLTLATVCNNQPYCCTVFYAFCEQEQRFVFSSDEATAHIRHIAKNPQAAASIVLETKMVGKIQGIQLQGIVYPALGELLPSAEHAYWQRFPYARLMNTTLWIFEPHWAKLTDNRLGFGKKLLWTRDAATHTL